MYADGIRRRSRQTSLNWWHLCVRRMRAASASPATGPSRFPSFYNWDLSGSSVLGEGGRCVSSRAAPRRAAAHLSSAFTQHSLSMKKKNGPHHAEFLTPVPPTSNTGVVAHLRDERLLREGCFKAVLDVKSGRTGCAGYFRPVTAL